MKNISFLSSCRSVYYMSYKFSKGLTVRPLISSELSLFSHSSPSLLVPEVSCYPGPHECTALDNPYKQHAATSEGLAKSFCLTSVAGPLRLSKAPEWKQSLFFLSVSKESEEVILRVVLLERYLQYGTESGFG